MSDASKRLLYDLVGADDARFSPYCWRTKLALTHKGLAFDTEPCGYQEIPEKLSFADQERVPLLDDSGTIVADSWDIASYLEEAYPEGPSLFNGPAGRAHARFFNVWADLTVVPALVPAIITDIFDLVRDDDRDYFKTTREARFGRDFEALRADRQALIQRYRAALQPVRVILSEQSFIGGNVPLYLDLILMGSFMSARTVSTERLLEQDDPVDMWFQRMLDQYDGYPRQVPARTTAG